MRIAFPALFLSLALANPALAQPGDVPKAVVLTPKEQASVASWVRANGHAFNPGAIGGETYAGVIAALGEARVYGIGEVSHGTHEDQQFKADLIKALILAGKVDMLALESNYSSGLAFDRYVKTGEGDPVALVRSNDFFRIWKGDEFAGLLTWIRAYNLQSATPVSIVAVDAQQPGKDLALAIENLAKRDPGEARRLAANFAPFLALVDGQVRKFSSVWVALDTKQQQAMLADATSLRSRFEADSKTLGGDEFNRAREGAIRGWQAFSSYEYFGANMDFSKIPPEAASRRDRYMADNLLRAAARAKGVALWAHNGHVAANYDKKFEAMGYLTLGRVLRNSLGATYRTLGFTYSRATPLITTATTMNAVATPPDDRPALVTNDTDLTLGQLFDRSFPDGRAAWLVPPAWGATTPPDVVRGDYFFGNLGWLWTPKMFQTERDEAAGWKINAHDVLVWFKTMTPQHRWPGAPTAK